MEIHGALSSGFFTAVVDQQVPAQTAEKKPQLINADPTRLGAVTYSNLPEEDNSLLAPITDRGILFDVLM